MPSPRRPLGAALAAAFLLAAACGESTSTPGGGTPDAGGSGGPAPDAGPGTPLACPAGALLCSGFEGGADGWDLGGAQHATLEVTGTGAHSGTGVLHVRVDDGVNEAQSGAPQALALASRAAPAWSTSLYVRAFVFLERLSPVFGQQGTLLVLSSLADGDFGGLELQAGQDGVFSLDDWGDGSLGWKLQEGGGARMAAGRWVCLEWSVERASAAATSGHSRVWVDGQLAFDFQNARTRAFRELRAGYGYVHPKTQSGNQAWVDDVAVSATRLGCD